MLAGAAVLIGATADLPSPEAPPGLWAASYWATKRRDDQDIRLAMYPSAPALPPQATLPARSCSSFTAPHPQRSPASIYQCRAATNTR